MRLQDFAGLLDVDSALHVWPPKPLRPLPDKGARYHSLKRLKDFIALLVFQRTIAGGKTQAFKVPAARIHIYTPDNVQENPKLPGIAFLPGPYNYDEKWVYALGPPEPDETTVDKFGKDTALVTLGYYVEDFTIETVASKFPMVRAINEGLRHALRFFAYPHGYLSLMCPDYFDQEACFQIISGAGHSTDIVSEVQGKRVAQLQVELWVPEVALIDVRTMRPILDFGPNDENIRDGNVYATLDG